MEKTKTTKFLGSFSLSKNGGGAGGTTNYNDLTNKPKVNGIVLSGNKTSADLGITTLTPFPSTWPTSGKFEDLLAAIRVDTIAVKGASFLGEVTFDDLPANLGNAEIKIEILEGTTSATKVIHSVITSGNREPYRWEYTSWNSGNSNSGWISFQLPLTAGTGISIENNVISATGGSSSNMVTTDTAQEITGAKSFESPITFSNNNGALNFMWRGSGLRVSGSDSNIYVGNTGYPLVLESSEPVKMNGKQLATIDDVSVNGKTRAITLTGADIQTTYTANPEVTETTTSDINTALTATPKIFEEYGAKLVANRLLKLPANCYLEFFKIVKDYNELRNELSSLDIEESILLSDVTSCDDGFTSIETLDKMASEMKDYLQKLSLHDMDVKNNLNKEMGRAFYNLISTGYHHMTTLDEIVLPYDLNSLNMMKSKLSDSLIEQAKLQNEEWKRLNEKLFKTEDVNRRIYQLSIEIDLTKSEIDKMIREWYKKTFVDNDIYSVTSNRVNGYLKYSLGAKEHLKNFIDNGEWPSEGEIALIEQARVLKKEETEVKLLRVANVKEQLETTYKDRRDKIERKLIKTEKSLTDLVGNYKDSSIMGIIGNTIVNN